MRRPDGRRGSTLIESTLVLLSFAVFLGGIMEVGFAGMAANAVAFAAQRAARWASVRGSASGHVASLADVQNIAKQYATPLNPSSVSVSVTWPGNKSPNTLVQVVVSYPITPVFLPLTGGPLTLTATACQNIVQ